MPRTILLVEDNEKLNEINRRALAAQGYAVATAQTLEKARECLEVCAPEVILLDVLLPDGNGIDFCAEIRHKTDAHILFLTSRAEHEDRLRGLDMGGDDYITKPYKLDEMLSRVGAALRRRDMRRGLPTQRTLARGPLTLDLCSFRAFCDGKDLLLTRKEFALLLVLADCGEAPVSKERLYEAAWNAPLSEDAGALWRHMSTLKKKLADAGNRLVLASSRGEGYSLYIRP